MKKVLATLLVLASSTQVFAAYNFECKTSQKGEFPDKDKDGKDIIVKVEQELAFTIEDNGDGTFSATQVINTTLNGVATPPNITSIFTAAVCDMDLEDQTAPELFCLSGTDLDTDKPKLDAYLVAASVLSKAINPETKKSETILVNREIAGASRELASKENPQGKFAYSFAVDECTLTR